MNGIAERVQRIIGDELGIDEAFVKPDARFNEDLGADSLDRMELSLAVESEFSIELPDADAAKMRTVQELVDYVSARAATV